MTEGFDSLVDRLMSIHGYDREHAELIAMSQIQTREIMAAAKRTSKCKCEDCDPGDCTDCECGC